MKHKNEFKEGETPKFGRLTLTGKTYFKEDKSGKQRRMVEAICECGAIRYYSYGIITQGEVTSCGCFRKEKTSESFSRHGLTKHPLYIVYSEMKRRCFYEKHKSFHYYGGRGITICKEWVNDFLSFYNWAISNGWEKGLDLDRQDNDGNYEPSNCKFVTRSVSNRNTRRNRYYIAFGEEKCLFDWAKDDRCVVDEWCLRARADNELWDGRFEQALTTPIESRKDISSRNKNNHKITSWGETKCMSDWVKDTRCLVGINSLRKRLKDNWDAEKAMTFPVRTEKAVVIKAWGEEKSMANWLKDERCLVKIDSFRNRLRNGWNPEEAMSSTKREWY